MKQFPLRPSGRAPRHYFCHEFPLPLSRELRHQNPWEFPQTPLLSQQAAKPACGVSLVYTGELPVWSVTVVSSEPWGLVHDLLSNRTDVSPAPLRDQRECQPALRRFPCQSWPLIVVNELSGPLPSLELHTPLRANVAAGNCAVARRPAVNVANHLVAHADVLNYICPCVDEGDSRRRSPCYLHIVAGCRIC